MAEGGFPTLVDQPEEPLEHCVEQFRGIGPGPLLLTYGRWPLSGSAMRTICQRLSKQDSIPKVHPHRCPHTFATCGLEHQVRNMPAMQAP